MFGIAAGKVIRGFNKRFENMREIRGTASGGKGRRVLLPTFPSAMNDGTLK